MTTPQNLEQSWKDLLDADSSGDSRMAFDAAVEILASAPLVGNMLGYSRGYILHICSYIRSKWEDDDGLHYREVPRGPFGYNAEY